MNTGKKIQDKDLEVMMGNLLRYGVLIAALVVLVGGIVYLVQYGSVVADYHAFKSEPDRYRNIKNILQGLWEGHGRSIIQAGILVLIATPVARVLFSIIGYILEKDYLYIIITLIVLLIIIFSMTGGLAG